MDIIKRLLSLLLLLSLSGAAMAEGTRTGDAVLIPYATFQNDNGEGILTLYYGEPEGDYITLCTKGYNNLLYGTTCDAETVQKVIIDKSFKDLSPENTSLWFADFTELENIEGIGYINTAEVTDMDNMFQGCTNLKELDLSSFNTAKVTDMNSMFEHCENLTSLNISSFNTDKVKDMRNLFSECLSLTSLNISNFNTEQVTDMSYLFNGCRKLTSLDLSNFNTAKVTDMNGMFQYCENLTSLDLSRFNTTEVTDMNGMFRLCNSLISLDLSSFNTAKVTDMQLMFEFCDLLETIYVSSKWSTGNVTESENMFVDCPALVGGQGTTYNNRSTDATYALIDGGADHPGYFTLSGSQPFIPSTFAYGIFNSQTGILTLHSGKPTDGSIKLYTHGENNLLHGTKCDAETVTKVIIDESFHNISPYSTSYWFSDFDALETIEGIENIKTDDVTDMASMFYNCVSLTSLDLSRFNTTEVTDMNSMFEYCGSLTSLDLSSFNTAKVQDMTNMFAGCNSLAIIYVSSQWSTGNVTESEFMFYNCHELVGGQGTSFDENNIDVTYAHNDGGADNPGYLTSLINLDNCDIAMAPTEITYTGSENKPEVTVAYNGSTLKETTDYTVAYADNVNAGTATVTVTGKGRCQGTLTTTFTISKGTPEYTLPTITALPSDATIDDVKKLLTKGFTLEGAPELKIGANALSLTFTPDDTENYETVKGIELTVTVNEPENPGTPVSSVVESPSVKVWSCGSTIFIESAPDTKYTITDLNGRTIKSSATQSSHDEIRINQQGIVVVIINGEAFKVAL